MEYSEKTLQYYNNLKNIGSVDESLPNVGTGIVGSPLCGDVMKLQLVFDDDEIITDVKFKVFGCVSAIAAMEYISELLKGRSLEDAKKINNSEVADDLELTKIKRHCSVLGKEAIEAAIKNYLDKKEGNTKMNEASITISKDASEKIKELLKNQADDCLGIGIVVSAGGCSGVSYSLVYENERKDSARSITVDDIEFFYDADQEVLINGLNIALINNSMGFGFSITNKNQISCENCSCKCD